MNSSLELATMTLSLQRSLTGQAIPAPDAALGPFTDEETEVWGLRM